MNLDLLLPRLLGLAWLLPLASFALIVLWGPRMGRGGRCAGYLATLAIICSAVLSFAALAIWLGQHPCVAPPHEGAERTLIEPVCGEWLTLAEFGPLQLTLGYYIDALTVAMFCMVTLVSACIHVYSFGYMHEELEEVTDPLVTLADGSPLRRRGRFHRFFQYLSLFCFSMLGLVLAGNLFMVFAFWELVGICSYLLIGFYFERKTASNAANKAFIVNRIGDFGMIVGLMAIWTGMGTLSFGDAKGADGITRLGVFSKVRPEAGGYAPRIPDGIVRFAARAEATKIAAAAPDAATAAQRISAALPKWRAAGYGYWLLVVAGLGIFCGCVGKSAQFPLHVWLPDAMEGPTPVSALIHAATMVAAGVYLVGRFYPVLRRGPAGHRLRRLHHALSRGNDRADGDRHQAGVGLFDRQPIGLHDAGPGPGRMVGRPLPPLHPRLLQGPALPLLRLGDPRDGHERDAADGRAAAKDALDRRHDAHRQPGDFRGGRAAAGRLERLLLERLHPRPGAGFSSGKPAARLVFLGGCRRRGDDRLLHVPLVVHDLRRRAPRRTCLSSRPRIAPRHRRAAGRVGGLGRVRGLERAGNVLGLEPLLAQARPAGLDAGASAGWKSTRIVHPAEARSAEEREAKQGPATWWAFAAALAGFSLATAVYGLRTIDAEDIRRQFALLHRFLVHKWWFDELYDWLWVRPVLWLSQFAADLDVHGIDRLADGSAGRSPASPKWTIGSTASSSTAWST